MWHERKDDSVSNSPLSGTRSLPHMRIGIRSHTSIPCLPAASHNVPAARIPSRSLDTRPTLGGYWPGKPPMNSDPQNSVLHCHRRRLLQCMSQTKRRRTMKDKRKNLKRKEKKERRKRRATIATTRYLDQMSKQQAEGRWAMPTCLRWWWCVDAQWRGR